MVDYDLNLDGWLEDATLFSNEPNDYSLNFDLLKANNEAVQATELADLPWFDENINLSLFEDTSAQLANSNNIQLSETDINEIFSLITSTSDNSYLSSDALNATNGIDGLNFELNNLQNQAPLLESCNLPFSPKYEPISEASSPVTFPVASDYDTSTDLSSPASVESSDSIFCSELSLAPENVLYPARSEDESLQEGMPAVFVTVCENDPGIASEQIAEFLSLEEISDSVRSRKFISTGESIPKIRVSLRNSFHPYSKGTLRKGRNKSERKKVQNKEAAARYRIKKRMEEKELSGEVAGLEAEQTKLKSKHNDLETEIKYLKKLMREMLEKKGII